MFNTKPPRSTPESRRQRREEARRIRQEFHPELFRERIKDQTQTPVVTADPTKVNDFRVQGSSLRTISRKKLEELKGQQLTSTFRRKPGQRPLQRARRVDGHRIKTVQQKPMARGKPLKYQGRRGRRMAPEDRKQEAASHALPCVCGCSAHLQPGVDDIPGKGLISRAHLESRRFENTRNADWNNLPACLFLNHWLDFEAKGEAAKTELRTKAQELKRRLTNREAHPILTDFGYYSWLADRRLQER